MSVCGDINLNIIDMFILSHDGPVKFTFQIYICRENVHNKCFGERNSSES